MTPTHTSNPKAPSGVSSHWDDFLRAHYAGDIERIINEYPDRHTLHIKYLDIALYNTSLASALLERPEATLVELRASLRSHMPGDLYGGKSNAPLVVVRVSGLPQSARTEIRAIREGHIEKFLAIEGIVRKVSEVHPRLVLAAFKCVRCGHVMLNPQPLDAKVQIIPQWCSSCEKTTAATNWELSFDPGAGGGSLASRFISVQKIEIQENPESTSGGEQTRRLEVLATDDLAGLINPGARVVLNGILRARARGTERAPELNFDIVLELNSIDLVGEDFEEIEITPEDEDAINQLCASPSLYADAIASIAPNLQGLLVEKEAVLLQLFGGVPKVFPNGSRLRGDIHLLLLGDPGTGKSELLQWVSRIAPRGLYASGRGTSGVGLTAATIQDREASGGWVLEAGALVLADKGLAAIDELDKMNETDRESLHSAMEQQEVSIHKANIHTTLRARCSILAAANPKFGRFDDRSSFPEQLDLDPALITRFDAIFALTDRPESAQDTAMAEFITTRHLVGEYCANGQAPPIEFRADAKISRDLLRKAIAYARRNCHPIMSEEVRGIIVSHYVLVRGTSSDGSIPITARQIEAAIRLAEASARVRLSPVVDVSDVERALRVINTFLSRIATTPGGILDMAIITTGRSQATHDKRRGLVEIVEHLQVAEGHADEDDVLTEAAQRGWDKTATADLLQMLSRDGLVYSPRPRRWRTA